MFRKPNVYVNIAPLFLIRMECLNLLTIPRHYYKKTLEKLTISEIISRMAVYEDTKDFIENDIELEKNSPEDIKELVIEAVKRFRNEWVDIDGDKLQEKFVKNLSK